jgi:hypothetical protein
LRIYVLHNYGEYVNRFLETLATHSPSLAASIIGIEELSKDLPSFVEDVSPYLPENMPESDLLIAIGVHQDILASLPQIVEKTGVKAVIVPLEDPAWCPLGLQKQIVRDLEQMNVEYSFPKPFCSLKPDDATPMINEFIELSKMGMPVVEVGIENELFSEDCRVLRSAPCGSSYYVIENLKMKHSDVDVEKEISKYHHAYPCTASMAIDNVLGDTILHRAGYMIQAAVKNAMRHAKKS